MRRNLDDYFSLYKFEQIIHLNSTYQQCVKQFKLL